MCSLFFRGLYSGKNVWSSILQKVGSSLFNLHHTVIQWAGLDLLAGQFWAVGPIFNTLVLYSMCLIKWHLVWMFSGVSYKTLTYPHIECKCHHFHRFLQKGFIWMLWGVHVYFTYAWFSFSVVAFFSPTAACVCVGVVWVVEKWCSLQRCSLKL